MQSCSQRDNATREDYVAGRLSGADTRAFETHADSCPVCSKAVARKQAIERAAKVMQRNQVARGSGPAVALSPARHEAPVAADDVAPITPARSAESYSRGPNSEELTPKGASRMPLVAGAVILVIAVVAVVVFAKTQDAPGDKKPTTTTAPSPPLEPTPPVVAAPQPTAPEPTPPEPPPLPDPEPIRATPSLTPQAPPAATPVKPPSRTEQQAATSNSATASDGDLPLDTDIDTLAAMVAKPYCGRTIPPLRARVTNDPSDGRAWALLSQCWAKRKRWQNALDAYDKVVGLGDAKLIRSLQSTADAAHAGLQAASETAEAPATPTPAPETAPQ